MGALTGGASCSRRVMPGVRSFSRAYSGRPQAIGTARADIARVLAGCPAADNVILCLSEVASNAVLHSRSGRPGGGFGVRLEAREGHRVRVDVDDDGGPWEAGDAEDGDEHGYGLGIVSAMSAGMGTMSGDGWRIVWFECPWDPA